MGDKSCIRETFLLHIRWNIEHGSLTFNSTPRTAAYAWGLGG